MHDPPRQRRTIGGSIARPAMATALLLLAAACAGLTLVALVALAAYGAFTVGGWGAALGAAAGALALIATLAIVIGRRLLGADDRPEPEAPPALSPGAQSLLEGLGVRRIIESSPWLTIGVLGIATVVVIGPTRLARLTIRAYRILSTLQALQAVTDPQPVERNGHRSRL